MKIIVTGAAGLIGSHLVDKLLENKHDVIAVDDLSFGNLDNCNFPLEVIDLTTPNCLSKFKDVDIIMSPSSPSSAFKIGSKAEDPIEMYLEDLFTISANLAGVPAMSIPHGFAYGLPIGLQLMGNYLEESKILNFAHQYQKNSNWHIKSPNLEEIS